MATCLRCDGCSMIASEGDGDLRKWWRLERYGVSWVEEPGMRLGQLDPMPIQMHSTIIDNRVGVLGELSEEDLEEIQEEMMEDAMMEAPDTILHFCSTACLCNWGDQARIFED